ncbi:outer membrane protein assembly factor BamE [Iodobacter sp. HSC-16F04]|uniref:Outer membrane protein assembly factor BamE n=1 Tax=Iodobacter violaceini TaxID=3044271 RepID=A0ABX0KXY1_9NEIS|nr:outer membrane protein assembly factor BamE [Iodobacter violacea]NHQ88689.1 outer membrane protein assembly factor BamE [Iodobacter violacea]
MLKAKVLILLLPIALMTSACSVANFITPYKLDIPQGNEITADQVAKLKTGMTRSQVRFLLGTPLLNDPFHANRWDYLYSDARAGELKEKKSFVLVFEGDSLIRFSGETLPAPAKFKSADLPAATTPASGVTAAPASKE